MGEERTSSMTTEDIEPTCDLCGEPEDHEPGMIEYDWNGETGNHQSCEKGIAA